MFTEEDFPKEASALDQVDFSAGSTTAPTSEFINADQLFRLMAGDRGSFAKMIPTEEQKKEADKKNQEGINRVNANSSKTGVVGFKDDKGTPTFTNVAIAADGKEKSIFASTSDNSQATGSSTPVGTAQLMNAIRGAKTLSEAQAAYDSLQEALLVQANKVQTTVSEFAANKIGIPNLQRMLVEAEAADKADPAYYPGIGDSPITAKLRGELNAARGVAENEYKAMLGNNLSFKMVQNLARQAEVELASKRRLAERQENRDDVAFQEEQRHERNRKEKQLEQASQVTPDMLQRIQTLRPEAFNATDANPQLTAYNVAKGHKDKQFIQAIEAEPSALPGLAFSGNHYAKTLVIKEEAKNTGQSEEAVKKQMEVVERLINNPNLVKEWAKGQKNAAEGNKATSELKQLELMGPDKKDQITARKIQMARDIVTQAKTAKFYGDLTSWDSIDLDFRTAIKKSQETAQNSSFDNVLTAYVGDRTGLEAQKRMKEFQGIMAEAAEKHNKSMFGMPSVDQGNVMLNAWAARGQFFTKLMKSAAIPEDAKKTVTFGLEPFAQVLAPGFQTLMGQAGDIGGFFKSKPLNDPTTGKPFGVE